MSVTYQVVNNERVVTAKVPVVAPAGIVRLEGTFVTRVWLVLSETLTPPVGAGPLRVTVPVAEVPPFTEVGLTLSEESTTAAAGALIVKVAVLLELL